jgi:magnesium transporter
MRSWLEHGDISVENPDAAELTALVRAEIPFWLDIEQPTEEVVDRLATALALHPLAVEDSKEFDQRGKLVAYGDVVMIVGFGLDIEAGEPIEVHGYLTELSLITMRRTRSDTIERLHASGSIRRLLATEPVRILHHQTTEKHDDIPPYIDELDARLATVEAAMLIEPRDEHLAEIIAIHQRADVLRRTLTPGRDLAARSLVALSLPGDTTDATLYATDLADELRLIVADLAAVGERCIAALGLHASLANNRQAEASRQFAAVATVFLPVTFVVGFFGMNFDVLVNDFEQGWPVFLVFGFLLNVVCVVATWWWLGRRDMR